MWWLPTIPLEFHTHLKKKKNKKQLGARDLIWNELETKIKNKSKWGPGNAMKQSEWRAISAFLWCMSATGLTSPTVSPVIWSSTKQTFSEKPSEAKRSNNGGKKIKRKRTPEAEETQMSFYHLFTHQSPGNDPEHPKKQNKNTLIHHSKNNQNTTKKKNTETIPKNMSPSTMNSLRNQTHQPNTPSAIDKVQPPRHLKP